jgi:hypothetical protein
LRASCAPPRLLLLHQVSFERTDTVPAALRLRQSRNEQLAERLKEHGLSETKNSIAAKLKRGTFPATFLIAVIAALGLEAVKIGDL